MFLFDVAVTNSWIIHKHLCIELERKTMTYLEFMMGLAFSLVERWDFGWQVVVFIYNSQLGTYSLNKVKGGRHPC